VNLKHKIDEGKELSLPFGPGSDSAAPSISLPVSPGVAPFVFSSF